VTELHVKDQQLALMGGEPVGVVRPDRHPQFSEDAIRRVVELLRAGDMVGLSKANRSIGEAEASIADWHGVPYCLGTSTGHASLHAALIGLEIAQGDEVITSPYTWGATVSSILANNATPVFADVDPDTGLLDPRSVEEVITPRTRAILVVHIYGQPADMTSIMAIAGRHGLAVIEDGSQAHGAVHGGEKVGRFGDAAGFSCMGGKLIATSEAGYMLTRSEDVYWKACLGTQHMLGSPGNSGRASDPGFPEALDRFRDSLIYSYRLSTINAVLLSEQLKSVDAQIAGRRRNVDYLKNALSGAKAVHFPDYGDGNLPAYHMLSVNVDLAYCGVSRDTYLAALQAEGVGAFVYVTSPIPSWPRLDPDSGAPRTMWQEVVRQSGQDYASLELPGCAAKIERSIELSWNYVLPDPEKMDRLAAAFLKVEEFLPSLQRWEREHDEDPALRR
jgi:dTDP-4-amino-4,6-dideoxygalactose transaminase